MKVYCCNCHSVLKIDDAKAGQTSVCTQCGQDFIVPVTPTDSGAVMGDFAIEREIGKGGMGVVYLAHQLSLDRDVALKVLHSIYQENGDFIRNFISEARSAASLNHQNIIQAYAASRDERSGIYYFAMEYVNGKSLRQMLEEHQALPEDLLLTVAEHIADALEYAWREREMIHRDIKPDNIMLTEDGRPKLADLGMAARLDETLAADSEELFGTPQYIAPELMRGFQADVRADIYSLGATLYHARCGHFIFPDMVNGDEAANAHCTRRVKPLLEICEGVSPEFSRLVENMMAKRPGQRYQNYQLLIEDIRQVRKQMMPCHPWQNNFQMPYVDGVADVLAPVPYEPEEGNETDKAVKGKPARTKAWMGVGIAAIFLLALGIGAFLCGRGNVSEKMMSESEGKADEKIDQQVSSEDGVADGNEKIAEQTQAEQKTLAELEQEKAEAAAAAQRQKEEIQRKQEEAREAERKRLEENRRQQEKRAEEHRLQEEQKKADAEAKLAKEKEELVTARKQAKEEAEKREALEQRASDEWVRQNLKSAWLQNSRHQQCWKLLVRHDFTSAQKMTRMLLQGKNLSDEEKLWLEMWSNTLEQIFTLYQFVANSGNALSGMVLENVQMNEGIYRLKLVKIAQGRAKFKAMELGPAGGASAEIEGEVMLGKLPLKHFSKLAMPLATQNGLEDAVIALACIDGASAELERKNFLGAGYFDALIAEAPYLYYMDVLAGIGQAAEVSKAEEQAERLHRLAPECYNLFLPEIKGMLKIVAAKASSQTQD